ncbi:MAG: MCE family protein [Planctomycetes bacterium]|nr:MCE family protein [Planctomycetota bacterium]
MINQKTKFFVGLFIAGGICITIVAIIWLGMSRFFHKGEFYAVYFDESVQGLKVDSPVKYRGVDIGYVKKLGLASDSRLIEAILEIETGISLENDMVAQLKVAGITGSMFIELDRITKGEENYSLKLTFPTEYPVLASKPSEISEMLHGIDDIIQKLNTIDITGISRNLKQSLGHLEKAFTDLDLKGISTDIKVSLYSLNKNLTPARWEKIIAKIEDTFNSLDGVIHNTNILLESATGLTDNTGDGIANLNRYLHVIGQRLEMTSNHLHNFLEQINDHPSRLLFGDAPPRRLLKKTKSERDIE